MAKPSKKDNSGQDTEIIEQTNDGSKSVKQTINYDTAKDELMVALSKQFTSFLATSPLKFENLTRYEDIFEKFLLYLSSTGSNDIIKQLTQIYGNDVKWEAIKSWTLNGMDTLENLMKYDIDKKIMQDLGKGIAKAFSKKYKILIEKACQTGPLKKLSQDKKDELITQLSTIESENLDDVRLNISKLKNIIGINLSEIDGFSEFEKSEFVVTNENIMNEMEVLLSENKLSKGLAKNFDGYNLINNTIVNSQSAVQQMISTITKVHAASFIMSDLNVLSKTAYEITKFFGIPGVGNILEQYDFSKQDKDSILQEIENNTELRGFSQEKKSILVYTKLIQKIDSERGKSSQIGLLLEKLIINGQLDDNDKNALIVNIIDEKFRNKNVNELFKLLGIKGDENDLAFLGIKEDFINFFKSLFTSGSNNLSIDLGSNNDIKIEFKQKNIGIGINEESGFLDDINISYNFDWLIKTSSLAQYKAKYYTYFKDYFTFFGQGKDLEKKLFLPNGIDNQCNFSISDTGSTTPNQTNGTIGVLGNTIILKYKQGDTLIQKEFKQDEIQIENDHCFVANGIRYDFQDYVTTINKQDLTRFAYIKLGYMSYNSLEDEKKKEIDTKYMVDVIKENFQEKKQEIEKVNQNFQANQKEKEEKMIEFNSIWGSIEGEKDVEIKQGSQFFLGGVDSYVKLGGGTCWIRCEISKVSDNDFSFRIFGTEFELKSETVGYEGKEFTLPKDPQILQEVLGTFSHNVLKFNKINNLTEFAKTLSSIDVSDYKKIKTGKDLWRNIKIEGNELKTQAGEKITHIGQSYMDYEPDTPSKAFGGFEVTFQNEKVVLKQVGGNFNKVMDYNAFFVFMTEKQLQPYTQKDFENNEKYIIDINEKEAPQKKKSRASIAMLINTYKSIKDGINQKLKRGDDLKAARFQQAFLNSSAFKAIGNVAGICTFGMLREPFKDLQIEALSELDSQVWKIIKDHKDKLGREGAHAKIIAPIIEQDIFNANNIYKKNPYKAIGYLLYAMENGGDEYFRGLKKHSGKGMWVRSILGPSHQQKFLNYLAIKEAELKNKPTDEILMDEIMRLEIWYIKETLGEPAYANTFGSKLPVELEVAFNNCHSKQKAIDTENDELKKSNYSEIYGGFKANLGSFRGQLTLGSLGALTKSFDTDYKYSKWVGAMLMPLLSGIATTKWDDVSRRLYRNMSRATGFTLGLYVRDAGGPEKVLRIIDYACGKVGIPSNELFSKYIGLPKHGENYDMSKISAFNVGANYDKIVGNIEKWWEKYGQKVLPIINNENLGNGETILTDIEKYENSQVDSNQKIDKTTYSTLKDFVDSKIFETDTETYMANSEYYGEGGPQYPKVIMNLGSGFMENVMFKALNQRDANPVNYLWKVLKDKVTHMSNNKYLDKTSFYFVGKKFATRTKHRYGSDFKSVVSSIYAAKRFLQLGDKQEAQNVLKYVISDNFRGYMTNPTIVDCFQSFEKLFLNNIDYIDENFIKHAFGEEFLSEFTEESFSNLQSSIVNKREIKENMKASQQKYRQALNLQDTNRNNSLNTPSLDPSYYDEDDEMGYYGGETG